LIKPKKRGRGGPFPGATRIPTKSPAKNGAELGNETVQRLHPQTIALGAAPEPTAPAAKCCMLRKSFELPARCGHRARPLGHLGKETL
jgi:hypothetical protein